MHLAAICNNNSSDAIYIHILIGELNRFMCVVKFHDGEECQKWMSDIRVTLDTYYNIPLVSLMKMLQF